MKRVVEIELMGTDAYQVCLIEDEEKLEKGEDACLGLVAYNCFGWAEFTLLLEEDGSFIDETNIPQLYLDIFRDKSLCYNEMYFAEEEINKVLEHYDSKN